MVSEEILAAFRSLGDLTGTVSDVLDQLGLVGAVPAAVLKPSDPAARIAGRALTVLNRPRRETVPEAVATKRSGLGEIQAHRLAKPGDVVLADECGVCFVPAAKAAEVAAIARRWSAWEEERLRKLADGLPLDEFVRLKRPE